MSWVDLLATTAQQGGGALSYASVRDKKIRQLQHALKRLAEPEFRLVHLPNLREATGKYEGFLLLQESGAPYDGGDTDRYTVPSDQRGLLRLPAGLFLNGWIHLLEDSELAFLLMLACLHTHFGWQQQVFVPSDVRLLHFGLGRDAYESHRILSRFGLVDVEMDPNRHIEGDKVTGYKDGDPPKLHRFRLLSEGFDQQAVPTIREAIERRLS
ncbi:hypothetical protein [Streptomyces indicus]|uniref:hypothetical protein n=1 Tax=Streptomyces indicus TaxID=417292 RepID=UPI000B88BE7C|nr:hypothetical protein [Streptomyces indicus]